MPILNWGTNQIVDLFKSFNPALSFKVFYNKLITDNKDFSYGSEIGRDDAQYHEADRYLKWLCYANICAVHRTLKCSEIGMGEVWGMMTHIRKREEITSWPGNRWHDAMYYEVDH